jgi:hypothetical protein
MRVINRRKFTVSEKTGPVSQVALMAHHSPTLLAMSQNKLVQ